jgi:hypothetical protein
MDASLGALSFCRRIAEPIERERFRSDYAIVRIE